MNMKFKDITHIFLALSIIVYICVNTFTTKDYVKRIKNGELKDYHGRPAKVADDVVFYCYVLCDIDEKRYGEYLEDEEFSRIYSGRSYYRWFSKISAHIEFIDFDHLLNDTKVRNAIFFNLLNGKNPLERGPGEY